MAIADAGRSAARAFRIQVGIAGDVVIHIHEEEVQLLERWRAEAFGIGCAHGEALSELPTQIQRGDDRCSVTRVAGIARAGPNGDGLTGPPFRAREQRVIADLALAIHAIAAAGLYVGIDAQLIAHARAITR